MKKETTSVFITGEQVQFCGTAECLNLYLKKSTKKAKSGS